MEGSSRMANIKAEQEARHSQQNVIVSQDLPQNEQEASVLIWRNNLDVIICCIDFPGSDLIESLGDPSMLMGK